MTEEEAKRQPCIGPEQCGQVGERTIVRYCIGSACKMAWRWIPAPREIGDYCDRPRPEGEGWYIDQHGERVTNMRWMRNRPPTDGYCGLAGKP